MKTQSEQQRHIKMHDMGRANLEVLRNANQWCQHLEVEMTSAGLLSEMWNLPIGSHRFTCRHAVHGLAGMNLRWIGREFLDRNCRDCPHHAPLGDARWGEAILREHDTERRQHESRQEDMRRQVNLIRLRLRALPQQARQDAGLTEQQILEWTAQIFDEDFHSAQEASGRLQAACAVASDLFSETTVSVLLSGACLPPFHRLSLPAVVELASARTDLHARLTPIAKSVLQAGLGVEEASAILLQTGAIPPDLLPPEVISQIVAQQRHIRPIGGWPTTAPDFQMVDVAPVYPNSLAVLAREFDRQPDAVLRELHTALAAEDKKTRVNACAVVRELMRRRPPIVTGLLSALAASLELHDDRYGDSADHAAQEALRDAFFLEPVATDQVLTDGLTSRAGEVQCLLIEVYSEVLRANEPDGGTATGAATSKFRACITRALDRCLTLLQDQSLDVDQLLEVVGAINSACHHHSNAGLQHFSTLFGTLAQLSLQPDAPRRPPRIVTLDNSHEHDLLAHFEQQGRQLSWRQIKAELSECLEELVVASPSGTADILLRSFSDLDSQRHAELKSEVVRLMGFLGCDRTYLEKVVPLLWTAYMDPSSPLLRARGIEAMQKCLGREGRTVPADIIEALFVHLCDTYTIVHLAAIRAVGGNPMWFTLEQSERIIWMLGQLSQYYRSDDRRQLEQIARSLLAVSRRYPVLRPRAVEAVLSLLPTGEASVDQDLIALLLRRVNAGEPAAELVARRAAQWLEPVEDDPDQDRRCEEQLFAWLHQLSADLFRQIESELLAQSAKVSVESVMRSCSFANLFGSFGNHAAERRVLEQICSALPSGQRFQRVTESLGMLADGARLNVDRQSRATQG